MRLSQLMIMHNVLSRNVPAIAVNLLQPSFLSSNSAVDRVMVNESYFGNSR